MCWTGPMADWRRGRDEREERVAFWCCSALILDVPVRLAFLSILTKTLLRSIPRLILQSKEGSISTEPPRSLD